MYTVDPTVTEPSVLYLNNQYVYPNGYTLKITNSLDLEPAVTDKGNYVHILFSGTEESETTVEVVPN